MKKTIAVLLLFLPLAAAPGLTGCAARGRATAGIPARAADCIEYLRADLGRIFSDPALAGSQWSVEVLSLDRGDVLFELDPTRLVMPASNNKILTAAAALTRLGPEFRYETRLLAHGAVEEGTLRGDLIVVGSGDPTTAPRFHDGDPFGVFREWAALLRERGIHRIAGAIVGDGRAFPPPLIGRGWEWDDLAYGYAAPVSALQFNENAYTLEVAPGEAEGLPAAARCLPLPDYVRLDARVTTAAAGARGTLAIQRGEQSESIIVRGSIALQTKPDRTTLAVESPTHYYLAALTKVFQEEGIDAAGAGIRALDGTDEAIPAGAELLSRHLSPPLSEILKPLLKTSQNLYAETLVRTLGLAARRDGSFDAGRQVLQESLSAMALPPGTYAYADGSGLSRHNLLSADQLVRVLRYMYRHPYFPHFYDALPIAGVDGTIRGRLKGTKAENNVRGKTGTIAYVRCLSGYVRTGEGEMLAFAMLANNFLAPNRAVEYVQDSALERLANFRRH